MIQTFGYLLFGISALIAIVNFYLSFVRYPIYQWFGWECRNVSGLPLFGELFLAAAMFCVERTTLAWLVAVLLLVINTSSIFWLFFVVSWMSLRQRRKDTQEKN